jgi:hypothetical protein
MNQEWRKERICRDTAPGRKKKWTGVFCRVLGVMILAASAQGQTPLDPNEGSRLDYHAGDQTWKLCWWGRAGRTYFLQSSDDLAAWAYLPVIIPGADGILEQPVTPAGPRFFLRLRYTDLPAADPYTADFDGDGVGSSDELGQATDPLGWVDADGDGLPDDWELFHGQANPGNDADGDSLSNLTEYQYGTNPGNPDTDGDGVWDGVEIRRGRNPLGGAIADTDGLVNMVLFTSLE